jgi:hypothetical protein
VQESDTLLQWGAESSTPTCAHHCFATADTLSHAELKAHGNTCVKLHVQQAFLMQAVRQRAAASAGRMFDAWDKKREDLPM